MGKLREIANKLFRQREGIQKPIHKITPDEVELDSYKRREYLDGVKKQLVKYRNQHELLNQKGTYDDKHQILKAKECFKDGKYNLRGGTNMKKTRKTLRFKDTPALIKKWR